MARLISARLYRSSYVPHFVRILHRECERLRRGYLARTKFACEVPPEAAVGLTADISSPTIL